MFLTNTTGLVLCYDSYYSVELCEHDTNGRRPAFVFCGYRTAWVVGWINFHCVVYWINFHCVIYWKNFHIMVLCSCRVGANDTFL